MGCNEAGVAVVVNALGDVPSAADGLPVAFVIRCVLEQESPAAARSFLERVPHASGQNYLVGDPGGIFDLECSADGVCEHAPGAVIVHTNHALVSAPGNRRAVAPTASSRDRFDWVTAALGASGPESITWQDVGRALADRTVPVFRVPTAADPWITFGSIVMELGRPPTFRLAVDHSGETAYQEIGFATQARPEC
jgi:hypothetical protein